MQTFGAVVRRDRSLLLSGLAVHGAARRARHLRAGPLPLHAMHPLPPTLLSTPRCRHTLFFPELHDASIVTVVNLIAGDTQSRSFEATDELPSLVTLANGKKLSPCRDFNGETSLYKTSLHYRSMGALVQADGGQTLVPQSV